MVRSAAEERKNTIYFALVVAFVLFCFGLFVEFGLPAFILAVAYILHQTGFRDKWSSDRDKSAYSVFNTNNERLLGDIHRNKLI